MSDPIDDVLQSLRGQRPPAAFAAPEAVRRRGRQRSQRTAVAAGLAVLAIGIGVGVAVVPHGGGRPPGPLASSAADPSPSAAVPIPLPSLSAAVLVLRPADLGPGDWQATGSEALEGGWYWADLCDRVTPTALRHRIWADAAGYRDGPPASPFPDAQPRFTVIVERYEAGWGRQNVAEVRDSVSLCSDGYEAVGSGFVGEDSLLVRHRVPDVDDQFISVVRVGDVVATILVPAGKDASVATGLARVAATRLR